MAKRTRITGFHNKSGHTRERCANASRYLASKPPNCNGGNPCKACLAKWEAKTGVQRKGRKCLKCGDKFMSEWVGNRMCDGCKSEVLPVTYGGKLPTTL